MNILGNLDAHQNHFPPWSGAYTILYLFFLSPFFRLHASLNSIKLAIKVTNNNGIPNFEVIRHNIDYFN